MSRGSGGVLTPGASGQVQQYVPEPQFSAKEYLAYLRRHAAAIEAKIIKHRETDNPELYMTPTEWREWVRKV